ncbi:hypothetical protein [Azospirillum argentinense]|uniref:hypothetical protein n=1 Tax=Azospirillum argentinense TaxID=2970906 RepID=UPI0032DEA844
MANLNSLKRSEKATTEGVWKRPSLDIDLEVLCRARGDSFHDKQASRQRKAAVSFGGDAEKLPVAMKRKINTRTLIDECLVDVKFNDDDGNPVSFEEFCELILSSDYPDLTTAAFTAVEMATGEREADTKEAVGN